MKIPFPVYKVVHAIVSKTMKCVGDHIVPIAITTVSGVLTILSKFVYDKYEKEKTKCEYKGWTAYKRGEFVYAKKGKELIVKKTSEFDDLKKMIDVTD